MAQINLTDDTETRQTLFKLLQDLGLTELESNLYIISLSLGPSPMNKIAEALQISRPNVYKIVQGLEKKGLAKFADRGKYSRAFVVESPSVIVEKLREKKDLLSREENALISSLPDLLALYHQGDKQTKIKILQGKEQYIKFFDQSLDEAKSDIRYFGSTDDFINFITLAHEMDWRKKRIKKEIKIKVLAVLTESARVMKENDKEELRETRFLRGVMPFNSSFQLFANKMIIFQPKAPLAVLIEDQYIVEMHKAIFDKLWEVSA